MKLTAAQIATVAFRHGARGRALATAVAVALAESEGNPLAHNPIPPDNSYGLWQINMIGNLGPQRRRQFGLHDNSQLFDPETNAAAARSLSGGWRNFTPWSTYGNGAYLTHWVTASHAAQRIGGGHLATVPAVPAGGGAAGTAASFSASPAGWLGHIPNPLAPAIHAERFLADLANPHTWLRVVYVVGGMALLVIGVYMIDSDLTKKAGQFVGGGAVGTKVAGMFASEPEAAAAAAVV